MIDLLKQIYHNKKILITGHTGFKGAWLTQWLLEIGADILGYSLEPPTSPSLFELLGLQQKIRHVVADIRDGELLSKTMQEFQPEFVFHLAAQPLVRLSYHEPVQTYQTNVIGTVNVLEAVRQTASVKVAVNITTDKCYENREWIYGYRENEALGGYDPYSSSKACAEIAIAAYRNSFFNPADYGKKHEISITSARAGNVIGGGDWAQDRLIPDCIRSLVKDEIITLRNPQAIRPWMHVLDPLWGYLLLGGLARQNPQEYAGAWNFGPKDHELMTVEEVVKKNITVWGKGKYRVMPDEKLHEARFLQLETSKARHFLKWQTVWNGVEAIEQTVNWYKAYHEGKNDMKAYTVQQIREYMKRGED